MFIVGNQLDSGVMVRLAMGGLLNGHTHFWTKDTIGHLGVGIHICYGDRKWYNHSIELIYIFFYYPNRRNFRLWSRDNIP